MSSKLSAIVIALAVSWTVIMLQAMSDKERQPVADEFIYLSIAQDLVEDGTFTDGIFDRRADAADSISGRFFTPAYPAFLAFMAKADGRVAAYIACYADKRGVKDPQCPTQPASLIVVQSLLAAIGVASVFALVLLLSNSILVSGVAALIMVFAGDGAEYARTYLSENAAFVSFYLFLALGVVALIQRRLWQFALCGLALGLATLSRPSYIYLGYFCIIVSIALIWLPPRLRVSQVVALAIGIALPLLPWMLRNAMAFGDPGLTAGYGGYILVQRIAYNAMTFQEWVAAIIFFLPDFGDQLAKALFPADVIAKLQYFGETSFYIIGNGELRQETLQEAGGQANYLSYLLSNYVFGDLIKHLFVTIPLTLKGIWIGKYLAIIGIALIYPVGRVMKQHGLLLPYLFLLIAPFFMAGLHGFVSVNVPRYNIPLAALYAFNVGFAVFHFLELKGWLPAAIDRTGLHSKLVVNS